MIELGNTPFYIIIEEKGRYGKTFDKSPVMPITDDNRNDITSFCKGQEITLASNDVGIEAVYQIVELSVNTNMTYPNGILQVFVVRCSADSIVLPGLKKRYKETNPCGEISLGKSNHNGKWSWNSPAPNINDIISVQPMNQPSGLVFYMDFKYSTDDKTKPNKNGDAFTKEALDKAMKEWNDKHLPSAYKFKQELQAEPWDKRLI